jgi:lysophospholipase L1-like esterase
MSAAVAAPPGPPPAGQAPGPGGGVDWRQWRRTIAFLLVLAALLVVARGEAPRPLVVVSFVVFAVVATVWVRGQYADSLDGDPWVLGVGWLIVLAAATLVCIVLAWVERAWGTFAVVAAVLFYLLAGFLIARLRARLVQRDRVGLVLLAIGLLSFVGLCTALLLGAPGGLSLILGLLAALTLPPGVALLSEAAVVALKAPGKEWLQWLAMSSGLTILVLVAVGGQIVTGTWWVLVALGVLILLVVALASSTQADIVVVLALIALMGVTPHQARPGLPAGGDDVLVALGDSYMSGEGAASFYAGTDQGGGDTCHRAPTAWAAMAGQKPQFDGVDFLACSGARTFDVRANPAEAPAPELEEQEALTDGLDTQLAQYRAHKHAYTPDLVVISVGGNDAGFATIGQMCLAPGDCSTQRDIWLAGLDEVERELRRTYAEVRANFRGVPVVAIPYPSPIAAEDASGRTVQCDQVALSGNERTFITQFLNALNGRVRAAAAEAHFYYLAEMRDSLRDADLQLCDPDNDGRPGINFIGLRSVNGAPDQRFNPMNWSHNSLHPNERGHAAMLRTFQIWRAENPDLAAEAPEDADAPSVEKASADVPGAANCSVYDKGEDGCRAMGGQWALARLGQLGLTWGWSAALAAAGAWMLAVGFFGWRRRKAGA